MVGNDALSHMLHCHQLYMVTDDIGVVQVHGEVVRIFAEGADQHLKHQEQGRQEKALAAKTGTSYLPKADPFPVPVLVAYLQKCLAATKHSRRYSNRLLPDLEAHLTEVTDH